MEKNNAICSICGKEYHVCLSCSDAMKLHPWKIYTDSQNCFKVFQVVRGLSTGVYTKDEAKEKFKNIDLSDIESFRPHIRDIIKNVLREEKAEVIVETAKEKEIENIVAKDVTEIRVEETEITENIVKPAISRKKNYRVKTE